MGDDFIAVFVVGIAMLVPILAIMSRHQQRMAELFRQDRQAPPTDVRLVQDNEMLRKELADVKALLYEQSIAIDNIAKGQASSGELSQRLEDRPK